MTDPKPNPKVSNKISPLAVIVAIILVGVVIVALVNVRGHHQTPTGATAPMAGAANTIMPQQPNLPDGVAPRANTNDSMEASPSGNVTGVPGAGGPGNSAQ